MAKSSVALAAQRIRTELKSAFPGIKFSVRSDNYSMGSSIDVRWIDGPVTKEVEKIANNEQSISRCQYTGEILSGGNRYVFCDRRYSKPVLQDAISKLKHDSFWSDLDPETYPIYGNDKEGWSLGSHSGSDRGHVRHADREMYHDYLENQSLYVKPEPLTPTATEQSGKIVISQNFSKNGIEINFPGVPDREVIDSLKEMGFRYSRRNQVWYNRVSIPVKAFIEAAISAEFDSVAELPFDQQLKFMEAKQKCLQILV